ncbi:MAG: hypothetical protein IPL75_08965 [Acidobacteria bacterium]|nr:hypothetical protein [Acidobacteriota bacterium]
MSGLNDPILPGPGATDYERYLRTDELLALQKTPAQMAHRDELLFQTIHQSSELWMKLACFELDTVITHVQAGRLSNAIRPDAPGCGCARPGPGCDDDAGAFGAVGLPRRPHAAGTWEWV